MNKYIGCKIKRTKEYLKMTKPLKVQRLIDEFEYDGRKSLSTLVKPGSVLAFDALESPQANEKDSVKFQSVTGMLLHMVRHLRYDFINQTRECSDYMSNVKQAYVAHLNDMSEFKMKTKD